MFGDDDKEEDNITELFIGLNPEKRDEDEAGVCVCIETDYYDSGV